MFKFNLSIQNRCNYLQKKQGKGIESDWVIENYIKAPVLVS